MDNITVNDVLDKNTLLKGQFYAADKGLMKQIKPGYSYVLILTKYLGFMSNLMLQCLSIGGNSLTLSSNNRVMSVHVFL